jgi:hypothetical protein
MGVAYNTVIDQGADWYFNVTYQNPNGTAINLTNYTAACQLRSLPNSPSAVLTLTTQNGGITITALSGIVALHATATQTMAIDEGNYFYDVEIYSPANPSVVTRLVQGQITVSAEVTR